VCDDTAQALARVMATLSLLIRAVSHHALVAEYFDHDFPARREVARRCSRAVFEIGYRV
jgi:hypothetical protein